MSEAALNPVASNRWDVPSTYPSPLTHQTVSVVVPVYRGEKTLKKLVDEITLLKSTEDPNQFIHILEIILVWDGAQDNSAEVMKDLAQQNPLVKNVWLSRNFGQHAATLAGVARSRGDWVATLDEDGLHSPHDIRRLLKTAWEGSYQLVYGISTEKAPHTAFRNTSSRLAHWIFKSMLSNENRGDFSSFRIIRGDVGRSLSAYCGAGVYLDVALQWVTLTSGSCPISLRKEWRPSRSYSPYRLMSHFRRLVLSSPGTPLRAISMMGLMTIFLSLGLTGWALYQKLTGNVPVQGWTSLFILISFLFGVLMVSIGILAEYIGLILSISMGKPLYLVQSRAPGKV
ncbi:MAG: glycosyltransferase family 2 protein [Deltaproteobacteria bacterium]|jgi:glycosyltransferase involved in cell wall biosynthesis